MKKNYYIGLDMGTNSVGWAVCDELYNLIKVKGRDYWGSYLFETAKTAVDTRMNRTARRRLARVRSRLNLLQELFAQEITKKDPSFFIRLENSKYFPEDKAEAAKGKFLLFNDADFTDKDYYKQYPTIFHLRRALIEGDITDVRLLYLALHHIIKNRGHFLFDGQDFSAGDKSRVVHDFNFINGYLSQLDAPCFPIDKIDKVFDILCNRDFGIRQKCSTIKLLVPDAKNKQIDAVIKGLSGATFSLEDLFASDENFGEMNKLVFNDKFEESFQKLAYTLDDDRVETIAAMKRIYDLSILQNILMGREFISIAKTDSYQTHTRDLADLKKYIRTRCPEYYARVFRRIADVNNYSAYIGMDKNKSYKKCSQDDFYSFLKKEIKIDDENILARIEKKEFLPLQISSKNCIIPYQVHLVELKAILKNAERNFPFLKEVSDNMSVSEKIISLMTFRIPYFVGPLTDKKTKHSWMIKREGFKHTSVTPWNFEKVVDLDASEQEFIRRMTNKCTFLVGEDVLPASSLLYSEFVFLDELNKLRINGVKDEQAKNIILELAHSTRKITLKKCCSELIKRGMLPKGSKVEEVFSGIDEDFKGSLSSYIDFKNIIGDKVETHSDMCEQIILWITLMSDKKRLSNLIKKEYGNILSDDQIKAIKGLNYSKWGRFSRKLLAQTYAVDSDGVIGDKSIIEMMRSSNETFMQLMSYRYGYHTMIELTNKDLSEDEGVTYRTIDNLYCSPSIKRPIWSAVKIVREIEKVMGCAPKKIFIEMTRKQVTNENKSGRTKSRKQALLELYKSIGSEYSEWVEKIEKTDDSKFNSDKIYFYYTQMGRDIYTGKPIKLEDVFNTEMYDIDHIYPQSKIKDDSLNNRVLGNKHFNQYVKKDIYPLPGETRKDMRPFWDLLRSKKLISEEKYARLTRSTPLTVDECTDFINRQLVETAQSTKAAATIFRKMYKCGGTEIVYARASNANDLKDRLKLVKVRELNDLHHAKDAYINIVAGNVFNTRFNHNAEEYFKQKELDSYNLKRIYDYDIVGAWHAGDEKRIRAIASRNTCRVVQFNYKVTGALFNATIKPAGTNSNLIPLKGKGPLVNVGRYGGYDSVTASYFMLVKCTDKKGKDSLRIVPMTILADTQIKNDEDRKTYCVNCLGLVSPQILISCIKKNTLLSINGSYAWLRGYSGQRLLLCNASQLYLDDDSVKYLKQVMNYLRNVKKYRNADLEVGDTITVEKSIALFDTLLLKLGSPIYTGLETLKLQYSNLVATRNNFVCLCKADQCRVLAEILKLMQCNSSTSDLRLIGGGEHSGRIRINMDVTDVDIKMISLSPTGHHHHVIDFSQF